MLFCNIALYCNIVFVMERLYISGRFLGHSQGCGLSRLRSKPNLQQDILERKSLTTKSSYILRRSQNSKKNLPTSLLFPFCWLIRKSQFQKKATFGPIDKGQKILKCPFGVTNLIKKTTKFL